MSLGTPGDFVVKSKLSISNCSAALRQLNLSIKRGHKVEDLVFSSFFFRLIFSSFFFQKKFSIETQSKIEFERAINRYCEAIEKPPLRNMSIS